MRAGPGSVLLALAGVALVALVCATWPETLGPASGALLFLLPVLLASARAGLLPGLAAAGAGALAYNFFLLPPRLTFRIHGPDNVVSLLVLVAVAFVTSRLATALKTREQEAEARAQANAQVARLSALLGRGAPDEAMSTALEWFTDTHGESRILERQHLPNEGEGFSTLDLSAAAWAMHNGDITGHGTSVMPAADWTFLPLGPRPQTGSDLLAVARPASGDTRPSEDIALLQTLARLTGQVRDRIALEEERRTRERLEDRDALRRTFLASMAHDFRTPLTVVTGELAKLARNGDPGTRHALAATRQLDRMMHDLIGAARIESGALQPQIEPVDLIDMVTDAREAIESALANLTVEQHICATLPLVAADPVLLRHILINLFDNAARHAGTRMWIAADARADAIILTVDDDGPGVPAAERDRIFERFARIEGGDRIGGSGLGLAIVKGFAETMAMTVGLEEGQTGGACFRLSLPVWQTRATI